MPKIRSISVYFCAQALWSGRFFPTRRTKRRGGKGSAARGDACEGRHDGCLCGHDSCWGMPAFAGMTVAESVAVVPESGTRGTYGGLDGCLGGGMPAFAGMTVVESVAVVPENGTRGTDGGHDGCRGDARLRGHDCVGYRSMRSLANFSSRVFLPPSSNWTTAFLLGPSSSK